MEAYLLEVLNLFGRWFHMIVGIAWIGASFYFVWLDDHLLPAKDPDDVTKGVSGEVWSLHGGGFYHAQKYGGTPAKMPETLHWFKWEAYTTWLSGMFMLALIYWLKAEIYTIDASVAELSKTTAISIGIATIVLGWFIYDLLCKSALGKDDKKLGIALFIFVSLVAIILCQLFSGRSAYIHFGAMLGTIMAANVFFVIMPGQRKLVAAVNADSKPDLSSAIQAKQRSVHNTYFTLPVLFVMISNHYAMTFGHAYNWLILIGVSIAGAFIRVYFVARHKNNASLLTLLFATVILIAVIFVMAPAPSKTKITVDVAYKDIKNIITSRCTPCHSAIPTQAGFATAPAGILFDTDEQVHSMATLIHQQAFTSKAMPIGNLTGMTDQERELINAWVKNGATKEE